MVDKFSNFGKDIREFTDDELYNMMNRHDPQFGSLYSDELSRRSTDRWSRRMVDLTILLFFLGFIQIFISLKSISKSWHEWLFLVVMVSFVVFYAIRLVKNKKRKT